MRIGLVTGEYPPMEGGVGDFTRELGRALCAQNHEVHVLTTAAESAAVTEEDGVRVYRTVTDWGWGVHSRINRWAHQIAPDVVNLQYQAAAFQMKGGINLYPRWQRRFISYPIVTTFHDLMPPYLFPKAGKLRQWSVWQLAHYSHGVIVTNSGDYTTLTNEASESPFPPVRLIPIGSNIAPTPPGDYGRGRWRAAHGYGEHDLVVGFFGFLNQSKGVETLLEAIAQLGAESYAVHLLFIGGRTGSSDLTNIRYADEIDALIRRLGLDARVQRTGFISPPEVSAALLGVDVAALPYRKGASLLHGTLHAALAHGMAILTTQPQTETPQLRDGENVLFVPPDDPAALADGLKRLWESAALRQALGRNAAELAREFSWERIAAHTAEFFRSLGRA